VGTRRYPCGWSLRRGGWCLSVPTPMENIPPIKTEQEPTNPLSHRDYHYRMVDVSIHRFSVVIYQELWWGQQQQLPHYKAYQSVWAALEKQILALQEVGDNPPPFEKK